MTNTNPWSENTGTVPDGVGPDTVIEVEYRDGEFRVWEFENDDPEYWTIDGSGLDIIRWRFV